MIAGFWQSVIVFGAAGAFFLMDLVFGGMFDRYQQLPPNMPARDRYAGFTAVILLIILVAQPILLPQLTLSSTAWWGWWLQAIGVVLILIGILLNGWARFHLRQFYTYGAKIQAQHQLIESGPYAAIRHPIFTAYFAITSGLALVNPSLPMFCLLWYVLWHFHRAARQEETVLTARLPGYAAYLARTGRYLPVLGSAKARGRLER